ncbi:MAG: hypothetical protein P1U64_06920 [Alcanivoracaceae bacterium]|nr:hypothetical protein [Alcanivoracaceae bacterium]
MSELKYAFIAFAASDQLAGHLVRLENRDSVGAEDIRRTMQAVTDELLDALFLAPATHIGLSDRRMRWVRLAADTIGKGSSLLLKRGVGRLPAHKHASLAGQVLLLRQHLPATGGAGEQPHIAFPVRRSLYRHARQELDRIHAGQMDTAHEEMVLLLEEVTGLMLSMFFDEPKKMIKPGPILEKMADMTRATIDKATRKVIGNIVRDLDHEQLARGARYMDGLLHPVYA